MVNCKLLYFRIRCTESNEILNICDSYNELWDTFDYTVMDDQEDQNGDLLLQTSYAQP